MLHMSINHVIYLVSKSCNAITREEKDSVVTVELDKIQ